jgi:replicative superfamily II helicase
MVDNLNAEISLGTVTNVDEAVTWLSYTYLYVRMKKNPLVYGMDHTEPAEDPLLGAKRRELIVLAAKKLAKNQMIIFDEATGYLTAKDLGRIASNFYIKHTSIEIFNAIMKPRMTEADVLSMVSLSTEFDNIKARETEAKELTKLIDQACACDIKVKIKFMLTYSFAHIFDAFVKRVARTVRMAKSTFCSRHISLMHMWRTLRLCLTLHMWLKTQEE